MGLAAAFQRFHFLEQGIEALKAGFPKLAIGFEPAIGFRKRPGRQSARAALGIAAAGDEAGAFENLEMFRDGGLAHSEGSGEVVNRGLPGREASEDTASRGIGESGEGGVKAAGARHSITV